METNYMDEFNELKDTASNAAKRLLGCELVRVIDGETVRVRIVETEAYDETDAASHSYKGKTQRTDVMFGPAGYLYVYFAYGMHYCANVVVGEEGYGAAVLIRAVEPVEGKEVLERRRRGRTGVELANGPAKLCQALGIDKRMNGHNLRDGLLRLILKPKIEERVVTTTRVGISQSKEVKWRFYIADSPYISVKEK